MSDEIKILKEKEQRHFAADELKAAEKGAAEDVEKTATLFGRRQTQAGIFLVAVGVLALLLTQNVDIWHFWWLIFLAKPLFWGWGSRKRGGCAR